MYPFVFIVSLVHLFLFFAFIVHNSVNLVIGISSMRLNEGSKQISSQIVAKSLQEVSVLMFGLIFIEISRGPSLFEYW